MRIESELCLKKLQERGIDAVDNVEMKDKTTLGIGGVAEIFVKIKSEWELVIVESMSKKYGLPLHILGFGSNILASDKGVSGIVMQFDNSFGQISFDGELVTINGNVGVGTLIKRAAEQNLGGLEGFVGIPASVIGLVAMNGGAFGVEIGSLVKNVVVQTDGETRKILGKNCKFSYRNSRFINSKDIIFQTTLKLKKMDENEIKKNMNNYINLRKRTQPIFEKTAGSVYKNPKDEFAARLLQEVGLKGFRINNVMFSDKHANFIENLGGGKFDDVIKLIDIGREMVYNKYKIELETEIQMLE
ncbi:MAG: UDP-N-acetylmuramate dehydrogenase [Clostridia bacterium]